MGSTHSLPPSIETEVRDDMSTRTKPRSDDMSTRTKPRPDDMSTRTIPRSENAHQSSAVADLTNDIERQRQIAENELPTTTRNQTDSSTGDR